MINFYSDDIRIWFANHEFDDIKLNNFMRQNRSKQYKQKVIASFIEAEKLFAQKKKVKKKWMVWFFLGFTKKDYIQVTRTYQVMPINFILTSLLASWRAGSFVHNDFDRWQGRVFFS